MILRSRQGITLAAIIISSSILISRFMGLVRDKIISYWFGASIESDIYFTAFVIPDFINYLLAGGYFSITLIPILQELFLKDEKEAWDFFFCALFWTTLIAVLITLIMEITAPMVIPGIAPGFDEAAIRRLTLFVRIILPAQIFFISGAFFNGLLYLKKHFIIPSLAPLLYNLFIISGGIMLRRHGMIGFCWGVLLGAFVGSFLLPLITVIINEEMKFSLRLNHPSMKRFIRTALPLMLGQSIVVLDEQFFRIFGSMAGEGAVSRLNYARRLVFVPVGVVAQAAAVASYPFLAELFAKKDYSRFAETLDRAIQKSLFLALALTGILFAVAEPAVGIVFGQGRFLIDDVLQTKTLFRILLVTVPLWTYQQILGRAFYATGDTLTPVAVGTVATFISIPVFHYGRILMGERGIALASVMGLIIYCVGLGSLWRKRFPIRSFEVITCLFRSTLTCIIATVASLVLFQAVKSYFESFCPVIRWLCLGMLTSTAYITVWGTVTMLIGRSDLREFMRIK
ncbi:murein biosynthesis integral membrane protein MurJ [Thermodesulforhabdus norvegica]|uniref:Probable lipid II flippase MurJ n=1 Tax=Thermodesulforhabdus norvegica TaxID=39841 RepID=A0A1I4R1C0_9BACT|nr:murein biosynthesis integral membrane protein MurJ [Thermodesulforhabdus norvegica]SFM46079.1 putative peptidoglycan lipid II flippase [Thermodesulforhabdus norvegica]